MGTYAAALLEGLLARGHELTAVVPTGEEFILPSVRVVNVSRPYGDPTPGGWISLGGSFARVLARETMAHDIAHFTDAREAWRAGPVGIPLTGMVNDSYALDWREKTFRRGLFQDRALRSLYYGVLRFIERRAYHKLNVLIANSEHVRHTIVHGYGVHGERVRTIYPCLPENTPTSCVRLEGRPSVLFVGGNFERKGLSALLRAVARLRSEFPQMRIHVAGHDRSRESMVKRARALGLLETVQFHGWQPNERVRGMMAGADIFALPSMTEAFGLTYLEAMRAGTPVIATTRGGAREVFQNEIEALFVEPNDVEGLATAIRRLCRDPNLVARLRSAGPIAAERFRAEAMVAEIERLFSEVPSVEDLRRDILSHSSV